jgi:hypothetical protein
VDSIGPAEARILAVERLIVRMEGILRQNQRDLIELWQREWDAWGDVQMGMVSPSPTPTPTGTFSACCPGYTFPSTLTLVDNVYGNFRLTFDGISTYTGCAQITFAGSLFCAGPVSMPLFYKLAINGSTCKATLFLGWIAGGGGCPALGRTCASTLSTYGFSQTVSLPCSGSTMTFNLHGGNGPHPTGSSPVQTIMLP